VATRPERDPIDEEVGRALASNPGLLEELQEIDRRLAAGEVDGSEFVTTEEVRRRLNRAGHDHSAG
jgi:hypothetical protein